jgi:hypothetical protein
VGIFRLIEPNRLPHYLQMQKEMKPLFEHHADKTLDRVRETYACRGTQYGNTWKNMQWLALKATLRKFDIVAPDDKLRAIGAAALCDVKYQRLEGGYKDDTVVDGIAYNALWAEEMAILGGHNGGEPGPRQQSQESASS